MTSEIDYTNPDYLPTAAEYVRFFNSGVVTDLERDVLLVHYAAPGHIARNAHIADALARELPIVNGAYGRLGSKAIDFFGIKLPRRAQASHAFSWFEHRDDGFYYSAMHNSVRSAIELVGWDVEALERYSKFWDALRTEPAGRSYWEGREGEARVISRARNGRARQMCINHYGVRCFACGFDFEQTYGELGAGFIEVHHLELLSGRNPGEYEIDPMRDLRPVCSNCHRMLHRDGLMDIQELKTLIEAARGA